MANSPVINFQDGDPVEVILDSDKSPKSGVSAKGNAWHMWPCEHKGEKHVIFACDALHDSLQPIARRGLRIVICQVKYNSEYDIAEKKGGQWQKKYKDIHHEYTKTEQEAI